MRRTRAALIYKKTSNLRAVQLLPGHTKLESTVLHFGIEVEDALQISEQVEPINHWQRRMLSGLPLRFTDRRDVAYGEDGGHLLVITDGCGDKVREC